jgi:flavodoxin I
MVLNKKRGAETKTLVIYDTMYGFTEKIARAIGSGIAGEVKVVRFVEVNVLDLKNYDLLIFGSPTQGGRPLKSVQAWLDNLADSDVKGLKTAVFDTRLTAKWVKIFGYAACKIADDLKKKGASVVAGPEAFFVKAAKGPLTDGEEERARAWGARISAP